MEENDNVINLGGNKNKSNQNNSKENEVPQEFMDTEFIVPTEDVLLPSMGAFYSNKQSKVRVKLMTAEDENILLSPELIRSGKVLDVLLDNCIVDKTLSPDQMLVGDRNAILFYLRENGYGKDYPVKVTCPKCNEETPEDIDLSELKHKQLEIMPDASGEYEVNLPKTKIVIKFRLLNGIDETYLNKLSERTQKNKKGIQVNTNLTERYLRQIMEVNGNRDKTYIKKFISSLNIFDSLFFREYVREVEPGVNMDHDFTCKSCGESFEDKIPITAKLFWPSAKI